MNTQPTDRDLIQLKSTYATFELSKLRPEFARGQIASSYTRALSLAKPVDGAGLFAAASVLSTVAQHASDDEWLAFLKEGTLPDVVPLTPSQLEGLRGGSLRDWLGVAAVAVGLATVGPALTLAACICGIAIGAGAVYSGIAH